MSEELFEFGYTDLSHALKTNGLGVTHAKGLYTDDGQPLYVVTLQGECMCGEGARDQAAMITGIMLVDLIVELAGAARRGGMPPDRVRALFARATERVEEYPKDPRAGLLVNSCPRCLRPEPECNCARVGAGL